MFTVPVSTATSDYVISTLKPKDYFQTELYKVKEA